MATEEPKYEVLAQDGDYELRMYGPMIIAETMVDGDLKAASRKGFKRIAAYIFGDNTSAKDAAEKIEMTKPVNIEPASEKISMTAPVTMKATDGQWRMHFVMPATYTMETLPVPNNKQVILREVAKQQYAVIRFSGFAGEAKVAKKQQQLAEWMQTKNLTSVGSFSLARYNPPWTLPFLRRNEVMVQYQCASKCE